MEKVKSLKELRQEKGLSQVTMAIELGMSFNNYVNYERGYYKTMTEALELKISNVLGVEYHYKRG